MHICKGLETKNQDIIFDGHSNWIFPTRVKGLTPIENLNKTIQLFISHLPCVKDTKIVVNNSKKSSETFEKNKNVG